MNKTKKFLHMIISFAFAFVLAIGGIGIKSAKVASAEDSIEYSRDFGSDMVDFIQDIDGTYNSTTKVFVDGRIITNRQVLSQHPLLQEIYWDFVPSQRPEVYLIDDDANIYMIESNGSLQLENCDSSNVCEVLGITETTPIYMIWSTIEDMLDPDVFGELENLQVEEPVWFFYDEDLVEPPGIIIPRPPYVPPITQGYRYNYNLRTFFAGTQNQ